MRWRRDERGQVAGVVNAAILIAALIAGAGIAYFATESLAGKSETWDRRAARVQIPFIEPALPSGQERYDCFVEVGKNHGLTFTDRGWRSRDYPEPLISGDVADDRGRVSAWKYQMDSYIETFKHEFEACLKERLPDPGKGGASSSSSSEVMRNWSGSYALSVQSQSAKCAGFPPTLVVDNNGLTLRITLSFPGATFALNGELTSDGVFDLSNTESRDITGTGIQSSITTRIRGRFDAFNNQKLIRSGYWEGTIDGDTCTVGFEGQG